MKQQDNTVQRFDVGGIELERPFRVLRMGHFTFVVDDQEALLRFYSDLLGLQVTDTVDFSEMLGKKTPGRDGNVYFLSLGNDHHCTVVFPSWSMPPRPGGIAPGTGHVSHVAWQVSTMDEVINGGPWLIERCGRVRPGTRDPAGSNYNSTVFDINGLPNEIYYGMDQIGWSGVVKPPALQPLDDLPIPAPGGSVEADFPPMRAAIEQGTNLALGIHQRPWPEAKYKVDGVMLPRPFKIVRNSPLGLFVEDVEKSVAFYRDVMGLTVTESIDYNGHRCAFLRTNTEHHSLALYPVALRKELGLWDDTICAHYGFQVQNYRQLRAAIAFLKENGVTIRYLPPELTPGIDYAALAIAPDGHAVMLYYYMEQIGWDGQPRPASQRRKVDHANWPETLPPMSDTYRGFVFQGPLG